MNDSTTSAAATATTDAAQPATDAAASAAPSSDSANISSPEAADTETNPLKHYQDLVNSPATPDGHKVVAAVAAASTVTVAAVANWIMKATKK